MNGKIFSILSIMFLFIFSSVPPLWGEAGQTDLFLIDDFSNNQGLSRLQTYWQGLTDRVMGGRSDIVVRYEKEEDEPYLFMGGQVSLENNGGFLQVRLYLTQRKKPVDLRQYKGLMVKVRGNGEPYYIHLNTSSSFLPWSYHYISFDTTNSWQEIYLPFDKFKADNMLSKRIDLKKVISIAFVAAKRAFEAELAIGAVYLYK